MLNGLMQSIALGVIRDLSKGAGAFLLAHGYASADEAQQAYGAIFFLASLGLSVFDKLVVQKKVEAAHATAPSAPLPAALQ